MLRIVAATRLDEDAYWAELPLGHSIERMAFIGGVMPEIAFNANRCLNTIAPMIIVNNGVSVFNMPATALSMCVCAAAKRKAGRKIPIIPEANNFQ